MIFIRLPHATERAGKPVYAAIEGGPGCHPEAPPQDSSQGAVLVFQCPPAALGLPPDDKAEQEDWLDRVISAAAVMPAMAAEDVAELLGPDREVIGREMMLEWHVVDGRMPPERDQELLKALSEKYRRPPHEILRWRLADLNFTANVASIRTPGEGVDELIAAGGGRERKG